MFSLLTFSKTEKLSLYFNKGTCIFTTKGKRKNRKSKRSLISQRPYSSENTRNPLHSKPTGSYFRHNFNKLCDLVSQLTTDEMQPTGKGLGVVLGEAGRLQSIKTYKVSRKLKHRRLIGIDTDTDMKTYMCTHNSNPCYNHTIHNVSPW